MALSRSAWTEGRSSKWKKMLNYHCKEEHLAIQKGNTRRRLYEHYVLEVLNSLQKTINVNYLPALEYHAKEYNLNIILTKSEFYRQVHSDTKRTFINAVFTSEELSAYSNIDKLKYERILLIYAHLNSSIGYVQGMNFVLLPIFFTFFAEEGTKTVEEDSFFCFTELMSRIINNFIYTLDFTRWGITAHVDRVWTLLSYHDPILYNDLVQKGYPEYFVCIRWILLLFSREFPIKYSLTLWDELLRCKDPLLASCYISAEMFIEVRDHLIENSIDEGIRLLQNYPIKSVNSVLKYAMYKMSVDSNTELASKLECDNK